MSAVPQYEPVLTGDPANNHAVLATLLATEPPGLVRLPAGRFPLAQGITLGHGWALHGAENGAGPVNADNGSASAGGDNDAGNGRRAGGVGTWLSSSSAYGEPIIQVLGSGVEVVGLGLLPPHSEPGEHGGDRGTGLTVGSYLYADHPEWIERIRITGVHVRRAGDRAANCVAVMGAVRDVELIDVTVSGGCTGLAVHWGAVGQSVSTLVGPTYHPHHLQVSGLRVSDAFEGFYLSSVHDVRLAHACLADVDIGFRLLPGDNTDRFHPALGAVVGRDIEISDVCVSWRGALYGLRVAGWGRSEVDGLVSTLVYRDVTIRDVQLTAVDPPDGQALPVSGGSFSRSPVVLERAYGVSLQNVNIGADRRAVGGPAGADACCELRVQEAPAQPTVQPVAARRAPGV